MTNQIAPAPAAGRAQILLDSPAAVPALEFGDIAAAFATLIEDSPPQFAIGIFGDWGSGKTTLMDAIAARLTPARTVTVRFNAWRFEREPHLLVPLLDTIRESLAAWGVDRQDDRGTRAREVARDIGRVVRALATGLSGEVGLPGAKISYDVGKGLEALGAGGRDAADEAQSLYFAGFQTLSRALEAFARGGVSRIVVFVDDLDRCLPASALEVIEAMKLFFDLPGVVFVVGLDEQVVARAVASKLVQSQGDERPDARRAPGTDRRDRVGRDYIKKIFQVPYSLPPVSTAQLDGLLEVIYREANLDATQLDDLRTRVRRYLAFVAVEGRINPREVKRFINTYTLQTLVRPKLDRDTVLALQTLAFRDEWETAYEVIQSESSFFTDALRLYRDGDDAALESLWPQVETIPADFTAYMRSPMAEPLARAQSLDTYLFSLHSTGSTQTWQIEASRALGRLRGIVRKVEGLRRLRTSESAALVPDINDNLAGLEQLAANKNYLAEADARRLKALFGDLRALSVGLGTPTGSDEPVAADAVVEPRELAASMRVVLNRIQAELRILRDSPGGAS